MIASLLALALIARPAPDQPFPRVITDASTIERIAPGLTYGDYHMTTAAGPIVVHVLALAPHHPELSLDAVLSHDALTSSGETISSMGDRTNAIAGINGDYFDIGQTNQPVNVAVRDGRLLRTPRKRYALFMLRDGTATIDETTFAGQVQIGDQTDPLTGVNEMLPPRGGISILTPEYGPVHPNDAIALFSLLPTSGTPPFATYRIEAQADSSALQPAGYYLAFSADASASELLPNPGDTVALSGDLDPVPLANLRAAIGGGPLILRHGEWFDDPDGPRGGSYSMRAPQSGAALAPDGTLFFFQVDGRQSDLSLGVTPREFSSLMRAFGAVRGMEFDSGGSSEMIVRRPGDGRPTVANSPSDGHERPVADGIFVYEDAPVGAAEQIVSQPQIIRAMPRAGVVVSFAAIDAGGHRVAEPGAVHVAVEPSSLGRFRGDVFVARAAGSGTLVARSGDLVTRVPVVVSSDPSRVSIVPNHPGVAKDGVIKLRARAYDRGGYRLALPAELPWRTTSGTIAPDGTFRAQGTDALVSLLLGDHLTNARVSVGFRDLPIPFAHNARFMTIPHGGAGTVETISGCDACVALRYALGPAERAAYILNDMALPPGTTGLAFDLDDDGSGATLKIALHNAIDEEVLLPATVLNHRGERHVVVTFPPSLAEPARLTAIYVIGAAPGALHTGTIAIRNVKAVVAGSE